jgi:hypothetical protein
MTRLRVFTRNFAAEAAPTVGVGATSAANLYPPFIISTAGNIRANPVQTSLIRTFLVHNSTAIF